MIRPTFEAVAGLLARSSTESNHNVQPLRGVERAFSRKRFWNSFQSRVKHISSYSNFLWIKYPPLPIANL
jgi:hypothetical protein